jgi:hypothetical protein
VSHLRTQYLASWIDDDQALVFTAEELPQQAPRIMSMIERLARPVYLTRRGRFVAVIQPLRPGEIESRVLGEMAREIGKQPQG